MRRTISRRQALRQGGLAAGFSAWTSRSRAAGPAAIVESRRVITRRPHLYHGRPTLARRANGELLLVSSAGREAHVRPFGRVELMCSRDGGEDWSFPRVVIDATKLGSR